MKNLLLLLIVGVMFSCSKKEDEPEPDRVITMYFVNKTPDAYDYRYTPNGGTKQQGYVLPTDTLKVSVTFKPGSYPVSVIFTASGKQSFGFQIPNDPAANNTYKYLE